MEKSTGSFKGRPTRRATDLAVTTSNRNREAAPRSLGQSAGGSKRAFSPTPADFCSHLAGTAQVTVPGALC